MKNIILAVTLALVTTGAFAHSKVNTMTPANGSVVNQVPEDISLTFGKKIRLTKIEMIHADEHKEQLDLGEQKAFGTEFSVPLIGMGSGVYQIEWRGLGDDGHAMKGDFSFEVK